MVLVCTAPHVVKNRLRGLSHWAGDLYPRINLTDASSGWMRFGEMSVLVVKAKRTGRLTIYNHHFRMAVWPGPGKIGHFHLPAQLFIDHFRHARFAQVSDNVPDLISQFKVK